MIVEINIIRPMTAEHYKYVAPLLCALLLVLFPPNLCLADENPVSTAELSVSTGEAAIASTEAAAVTSEKEIATPEAKPTPVHGYISNEYRWRTAGDAGDQDMYQLLDVELGDPMRQRVTAHFFLRAYEDIDGSTDTNGFSVFDDYNDTYDDNAGVDFYYAYVDVNRIKPLRIRLLRFGRQAMYETPVPLYFDGARVETMQSKSPFRQMFGFYGGLPSYNRDEADLETDFMYGAFAQFRPWIGGKMQFHYIRATENGFYGSIDNRMFAVGVWHSFNKRIEAHTLYTMLDDKSRDALFRLTYNNTDLDFMVQGSYYELLETQTYRTVQFDPYYIIEYDYRPYREINLLVNKGIGEHFAVDAGFTGRKLNDKNDEGAYNHEFAHYFLTLSSFDVPVAKLDLSITGDYWDSYSKDDEIFTVGGEARYKINEKLETKAGTDYSLYKYSYYLQSERQEVRTYFAGIAYEALEGLTFDLDYTFERDADFDYHTVEAGVRYGF